MTEFIVAPTFGWDRCAILKGNNLELIITLDVGPRILSCRLGDSPNILRVFEKQCGRKGDTKWLPYGGHRLWAAPEAMPRTYHPDNNPVGHDWDGRTLLLTAPIEETTGLQKQLLITIDPERPAARVLHRLVNTGPWEIELAPWALTVMDRGTTIIVPQEPVKPHPDALLPSRPLVLWPYTDMTDPRFVAGSRHLSLRHDDTMGDAFKFGVYNSLGWAAGFNHGVVLIKRIQALPVAGHPDFGCNFEFFVNRDMIELETLAPLRRVGANGGVTEHEEEWILQTGDLPRDNEAMDQFLAQAAQR